MRPMNLLLLGQIRGQSKASPVRECRVASGDGRAQASAPTGGIGGSDFAKRVRRQDRGAWDELVAQEHGRLFNLHLRLSGDRETAADLTQETFRCAYESCGGLSGGRPEAWLYGVAMNVNRNWWRRTNRHEPPEELPDELPDPEPTAEELAVLREQAGVVHQALAELPAIYREAVALRYFAGLSAVEIAGVQKLQPGAVRWRLHHALRLLWAALQPHLGKEL